MDLPKVRVNPQDIQIELQTFFETVLTKLQKRGYTFETPVPILVDEENDTKIFYTGFFKNTNAYSDKTESIYFIYYDGCDCVNLVDEPSNRYTISEIQKCSLQHIWLAYKQCETELSNINL